METGFDSAQARLISGFSIADAGIALFLLALGVGLLVLVQSGTFSGPRVRWLWGAAALFIVADLGRANLPWIHYQDYRVKYAANPVLDVLRENPHQKRVTSELLPSTRSYLLQDGASIWPALSNEWLQHHFQFYNIQSLDIIQMPRIPELDDAYMRAFRPANMSDLFPAGRLWQLTGTRFVFAEAGMLDLLNDRVDSARPFRMHTRFDIAPRPGVVAPATIEDFTAVTRPDGGGKYALIENTSALPRARLYAHWQTVPGDHTTLRALLDPGFNPHETVLVTGRVPGSSRVENGEPGTVEYVHYEPRRIVLRAETDRPSILLLNDRYEADWNVWVNGEPAGLLRCNYIMRGVYLEPGAHEVTFRFQPPDTGLFVSLGGLAAALVLGGLLLVPKRKVKSPQTGKVS